VVNRVPRSLAKYLSQETDTAKSRRLSSQGVRSTRVQSFVEFSKRIRGAVPNVTTTIDKDTSARDSQVAVGMEPAAADTPTGFVRADVQRVVATYERALEQSVAILDTSTGSVVKSDASGLSCDFSLRLGVLEEVARRGRPDIVDEVSPLLMVALPLPVHPAEPSLVGVAVCLTESIRDEAQLQAAAAAFGVETQQAWRWAQTRVAWPPQAVLQTCTAVAEKIASQQQAAHLKQQVAEISAHLLNTFEEITLVHRLTEHLSLSKSVVELCELSVRWLSDVIPAGCIAIKLNAVVEDPEGPTLGQQADRGPLLINHGECPLDGAEVDRFIERLGPHVATEPLVLNRAATSSPTWFYPSVRELISVPIREGDHCFGWLLALNHTGSGEIANSEVEFGTVEASLMSSVATILGIHNGNISLYQEQADFFASVVRALTSAIDAKDPYTCGHSDRVARLSVAIARRMGCSSEELDTIYLSGLLHDIGKIGIDDNVLRKPGALTEAELEHIKAHPHLGFKILHGVKQLDKVLPVVLHHHEAWDGGGYPAGLRAEETPRLARIVAVADSIDAMSSDRPYRKGIPDEKLDRILREGAGKQWDPQVVNAVFQVRDELRRIGQCEREPLSLDVGNWRPEFISGTNL
jgi:HD-GYP domain-containing protein (c-di-GMP phosphodiesterase class II)